MLDETVPVHPVRIKNFHRREIAVVPQVVSMRAYEVYCEIFSPQPAMVEGNCRGGFGVGELIAFLYARSFPKNEWRARMDEAFRGMANIE